ncbi:sensor histidine kinase [Lysobacter sp. A421]
MSTVLPAPIRWIGNPWRALSGWLSRAPIDGLVDRRNAPMLQVLLLLLAFTPPLMWLYRIFGADTPWRPGETASLVTSIVISVFALFDLWLVRRGRFQGAVRLLMVVLAVGTLLGYLGSGFGASRYEQPIQAVWLIIAGLVIGRRALWLMYGWMVLAFAVGSVVDFRAMDNGDAALVAAVDCIIAALIFLFIAIVVDRTVAALRESLQAATLRGDELTSSNERLQAEILERERIHGQLIHAQKVEAVGRLASGLAHDFNHLLGLIIGHAERGRRDDSDPESQRKALAGVESAARRATAISQKLLNFSRRDVAMPETFDASQALRDMQPMLRQLFDPTVAIRMDVPEQSLPIRFDHAQFDLMILNIAANANQAMADGGTFHVELHPPAAKDRLALGLRDTGHGMDEATRARVFEAFFTTRPVGQGTGLGLAVAHDLIVDAGGWIEVDSMPGEGTTVRIELPLEASTVPSLDADLSRVP